MFLYLLDFDLLSAFDLLSLESLESFFFLAESFEDLPLDLPFDLPLFFLSFFFFAASATRVATSRVNVADFSKPTESSAADATKRLATATSRALAVLDDSSSSAIEQSSSESLAIEQSSSDLESFASAFIASVFVGLGIHTVVFLDLGGGLAFI